MNKLLPETTAIRRYFLDTNILLYTFDERYERKMAIAQILIRDGLERNSAVISYQVIQEFYNAMFKKFPTAQTPEDAAKYLVDVLCPMLRVESSLDLFDKALGLNRRYKLSWYDSLIVAAAIEAKCDVVYTEDLQHNQRFGDLTVVNPFI